MTTPAATTLAGAGIRREVCFEARPDPAGNWLVVAEAVRVAFLPVEGDYPVAALVRVARSVGVQPGWRLVNEGARYPVLALRDAEDAGFVLLECSRWRKESSCS